MKHIFFMITFLFAAIGTAYSANTAMTKIIGGHEVQVTHESDKYIHLKRNMFGNSWNGIYYKEDGFFVYYNFLKSKTPNHYIIETITFTSKGDPVGVEGTFFMTSEFSCSKGMSRTIASEVSDRYFGEGQRTIIAKDGYSLLNGSKQTWFPFDDSKESGLMRAFCKAQK